MLNAIYEFVKTSINQQIVGDPVWATVALVGQFLFGGRFVLQWIASEYKRKSYMPIGFWYLSIAGGTILFCYSIHIKNPIFMLSFFLSTLIYIRNLHLLHLESRKNR